MVGQLHVLLWPPHWREVAVQLLSGAQGCTRMHPCKPVRNSAHRGCTGRCSRGMHKALVMGAHLTPCHTAFCPRRSCPQDTASRPLSLLGVRLRCETRCAHPRLSSAVHGGHMVESCASCEQYMHMGSDLVQFVHVHEALATGCSCTQRDFPALAVSALRR